MDFEQIVTTQSILSGPFPAILGKGPWPKLGKKID